MLLQNGLISWTLRWTTLRTKSIFIAHSLIALFYLADNWAKFSAPRFKKEKARKQEPSSLFVVPLKKENINHEWYICAKKFSDSDKSVYFDQIARTSCNQWFKTLDTFFCEYLARVWFGSQLFVHIVNFSLNLLYSLLYVDRPNDWPLLKRNEV